MSRPRSTVDRIGSDSLTAVAASITIVGVIGLLISALLKAPTSVIAILVLLLVVGWIMAIVAAVIDARRHHKTVPGALWDGFKTSLAWLFWFVWSSRSHARMESGHGFLLLVRYRRDDFQGLA